MKKSKRETMPKHFKSYAKAGDFWDTHDLSDYWDKTKEVDLRFNLRKRRCYISILPGIEKRLERISERQGISIETIVNMWLREKLQTA